MGPELTTAIEPSNAVQTRVAAYAWLVFAITTGLLLSDYMSRQVLNAIFPQLKADWLLSDTELGSLVGIVAVMVGVLTVPLSLLADAFGRVKSIAAMALLWNLATLGCGLATGYGEMFVARLMVGVGAAAFGGVGAAVLMGVFPATMRSTINGAFLAGSIFGSVLGLALGGVIAAHFGWRAAFIAMASFGIALALCYPFVVSDVSGTEPAANQAKRQLLTWAGICAVVAELFATPSLIWALIGSGLQLAVIASFIAWMPSFLQRDYAMATHTADAFGSLFVLVAGLGMILCSLAADRIARHRAARKATVSAIYCLLTTGLLAIAFQLPHGIVQLVFIGIAMFFSGGAAGPAGAIAADTSREAVRATVMALGTLTNNLLGLAPGPILVGFIADHSTLTIAMRIIPLIGLGAAVSFWTAKRHYDEDMSRILN